MRLEAGEDRQQLLVDLRELGLERVEIFGVADTGHDVFALSVHEEVAVGMVVAGRRISGESDTGARVVVTVAEHHRLDVDSGAEIVRDLLANAVRDGTRTVPALEDGFHRSAQLGLGLLREGFTGDALDDVEVLGAQSLEHGRRQFGI